MLGLKFAELHGSVLTRKISTCELLTKKGHRFGRRPLDLTNFAAAPSYKPRLNFGMRFCTEQGRRIDVVPHVLGWNCVHDQYGQEEMNTMTNNAFSLHMGMWGSIFRQTWKKKKK